MRKHFCFAIAAALMGLAMIVWARASIVGSNGDGVMRPKVELAPAAPNPNLPFQVLSPVY